VWKSYRSTNKRYARDNRLMMWESPNRTHRLTPRCWLIASWSWKRFQRFGCSPIKAVRELSSNRCETGWFLSIVKCEMEELTAVREDPIQVTTVEAIVIYKWHVALTRYERRTSECISRRRPVLQLAFKNSRLLWLWVTIFRLWSRS